MKTTIVDGKEIPVVTPAKVTTTIKNKHTGVIYQTEEELLELIKLFKPDVRILGEDYLGKSFTGDDLHIEVIYTTRSHNWSTTKIKDLITRQTIQQNPNILNDGKEI